MTLFEVCLTVTVCPLAAVVWVAVFRAISVVDGYLVDVDVDIAEVRSRSVVGWDGMDGMGWNRVEVLRRLQES